MVSLCLSPARSILVERFQNFKVLPLDFAANRWAAFSDYGFDTPPLKPLIMLRFHQ
jgi:hypothetical protein